MALCGHNLELPPLSKGAEWYRLYYRGVDSAGLAFRKGAASFCLSLANSSTADDVAALLARLMVFPNFLDAVVCRLGSQIVLADQEGPFRACQKTMQLLTDVCVASPNPSLGWHLLDAFKERYCYPLSGEPQKLFRAAVLADTGASFVARMPISGTSTGGWMVQTSFFPVTGAAHALSTKVLGRNRALVYFSIIHWMDQHGLDYSNFAATCREVANVADMWRETREYDKLQSAFKFVSTAMLPGDSMGYSGKFRANSVAGKFQRYF